MGGESFLAGLLGGGANVMLQKEERDFQAARQDKAARINLLQSAIASGLLDEQGISAAGQMLDELLAPGARGAGRSRGGKAAKGGGGLGSLLTDFGKLMKGGGKGEAPAAAGGAAPAPATAAPESMTPMPAKPAAAPRGLPPLPQRPTGLGGVLSHMRTPEQIEQSRQQQQLDYQKRLAAQQAEQGRAQNLADFSTFKTEREKLLNRPLAPQEATELWDRWNKVQPPTAMRVIGAQVPGDKLPADAATPWGEPIPPEWRGSSTLFKPVELEGKLTYAPTVPSSAKTPQLKINEISGSPYSVSGPAGTFTKDDPNIPPAYKSYLAAAEKAVRDTQQRKAEDETRRDALMQRRLERTMTARDEADARKLVRKRVDLYADARKRYSLMERNTQKAVAGDLQAQVLVLFNHIGMTLSAQRGARITNAEIQRAVTARSLPEHLQVMYEQLSKRTILSQEQIQQMVDLSKDGVAQALDDVRNEASDLGVDIKKVAPGLDISRGADTGPVTITHADGTKTVIE